jgi:hypothetical protein
MLEIPEEEPSKGQIDSTLQKRTLRSWKCILGGRGKPTAWKFAKVIGEEENVQWMRWLGLKKRKWNSNNGSLKC